MDNIVLFNITLDHETHLWNILSEDPAYDVFSQHQIMGGSQFMVMQEITERVALDCDKVAAFKITEDGPKLDVLQIEEVISNGI